MEQPQPTAIPTEPAMPAPTEVSPPPSPPQPPRQTTTALSRELLQQYTGNHLALLGVLLGVSPSSVEAVLQQENHTALLGLLTSVLACDGRDEQTVAKMALMPLRHINEQVLLRVQAAQQAPPPPPPPPPPQQHPYHQPQPQQEQPYLMHQREPEVPPPGQVIIRGTQEPPVKMGPRVPPRSTLSPGLNHDVGFVDDDVAVQRSEPLVEPRFNEHEELPLIGTSGSPVSG